jgi:hypothetical protein
VYAQDKAVQRVLQHSRAIVFEGQYLLRCSNVCSIVEQFTEVAVA